VLSLCYLRKRGSITFFSDRLSGIFLPPHDYAWRSQNISSRLYDLSEVESVLFSSFSLRADRLNPPLISSRYRIPPHFPVSRGETLAVTLYSLFPLLVNLCICWCHSPWVDPSSGALPFCRSLHGHDTSSVVWSPLNIVSSFLNLGFFIPSPDATPSRLALPLVFSSLRDFC